MLFFFQLTAALSALFSWRGGVALTMLIIPHIAGAYSAGIVGHSGVGIDSGGRTGCAFSGCHSPVGNYQYSVQINGLPSSMAAGENTSLTLHFSNTGSTIAPRVGANMATNGGILSTTHPQLRVTSATANFNAVNRRAEITHRSPGVTAASTVTVLTGFNWQAPLTTGNYHIYYCLLPINGDNTTTEDGRQICGTGSSITITGGRPDLTSTHTITFVNQAVNITIGDRQLQYNIYRDPQNGMLVLENNIATYTPNPHFIGGDSFIVRAVNMNGASTARISIRVSPPLPSPSGGAIYWWFIVVLGAIILRHKRCFRLYRRHI